MNSFLRELDSQISLSKLFQLRITIKILVSGSGPHIKIRDQIVITQPDCVQDNDFVMKIIGRVL